MVLKLEFLFPVVIIAILEVISLNSPTVWSPFSGFSGLSTNCMKELINKGASLSPT